MHETPLTNAYRYAIYFASRPDSADWQAGSRWLGRCAASATVLSQPTVEGVTPEDFNRLTAAPRRYGWHATLKAPFALRYGTGFETLRQALKQLSGQLSAFQMPALCARKLDDFLALTPVTASSQIDRVARQCVTTLHAFAAPLSAEALARRRAGGLTPEEDALLVRWGYPFVLKRFQFHLSLTGSLKGVSPERIDAIQTAAVRTFQTIPPCQFDSIALFAEPRPGADFVLLEHFAFR